MNDDARAERNADRRQRYGVRCRVLRRRPGCLSKFPPHRLFGRFFAGNNMDAEVSGASYQVMNHGTVNQLKPFRTGRFADDDLRDVMCVGVVERIVGDPAGDAWHRHGFAAKAFRQPERIGDAVALFPRSAAGFAASRR